MLALLFDAPVSWRSWGQAEGRCGSGAQAPRWRKASGGSTQVRDVRRFLTHSGRAATTGPRTSLVGGSGLRDVGDFL